MEENDTIIDEASRNNQQSSIAQREINKENPVNVDRDVDVPGFRRSTRSNFGVPSQRYTNQRHQRRIG